MEEEKKKIQKNPESSSVKKAGEKANTKSTKKTSVKKTAKNSSIKSESKKENNIKTTTKTATKKTRASQTKKKSTSNKSKATTSKVTTKKSASTKSSTKSSNSEKTKNTSSAKKTTSKKVATKTETPIEKINDKVEKVSKEKSSIEDELPKLKEGFKEEPKSVETSDQTDEIKSLNENKQNEEKSPEENLIITRQLDINLEDYTYNQEGLVEKVKSILEEENAENKNLEDPLKGEELFTEIFKDNQSLLRRIKKNIKKLTRKITAKKEKIELPKLKKVVKTKPFKPTPTRENKYKDLVIKKQQELENQERLRKERLARRYLSFDTNHPQKKRPKPQPRVRKKTNKSFPILIGLLLVTLILCIICINVFNNQPTFSFTKKINPEEVAQAKEREHQKQLLKEYNNCLNTPNPKEEHLEELTTKIDETTEYIENNYKTSVKYEDLTYGYTYTYNEEPSYYAASTIKLVDALYLYTKAANGEVNLNDTMTYTKDYKANASKFMSTLPYGSKVSIRTLIKYAIEVSDNSAHLMLIDYIGYNNLKEYGKSLGATYTLSGTDKFGYISVNDALIYLDTLNEFINNNDELGQELQSFLLKAEQNDLALPDLEIEAAHKYGEYGSVYHDIGIVYDSHPYAIAILTNEGQSRYFESKVKDINKHIYELHQAFYTNHEQVCHLKVYGSE